MNWTSFNAFNEEYTLEHWNNNGGSGEGGHTNIVPQKVYISRLFLIRVRAFSFDMHILAFVSLHLTQTYNLCAVHLYTYTHIQQRLWARRSSEAKWRR